MIIVIFFYLQTLHYSKNLIALEDTNQNGIYSA